MAAQVALKRQQAAEDAVAMGLRCISPYGQLPPGPVFVEDGGEEEEADDDDEEANDDQNDRNSDANDDEFESLKGQQNKMSRKSENGHNQQNSVDAGRHHQANKRMRPNDENEGNRGKFIPSPYFNLTLKDSPFVSPFFEVNQKKSYL